MSDVEKKLEDALRANIIELKKARSRLDSFEQKFAEPIAIIGLSCRYPGGANSPAEFWKMLSEGQDAISEVPSSRWNNDFYYDPDPEACGKIITKSGGFLNTAIDTFDADFFNISPREAQDLDPQQRLLLEVTWEALELSGTAPESLNGSLTGVFLGLCTSDYATLMDESGDKESISAYHGTGSAHSTAVGRISYFFNFMGPSIAIDTACSSSLVALDEACKSLRLGESNVAIAGGIGLLLSPDNMIYFSKFGALSPDAKCKTFDARANGYARGEGCGIVVLKRLSDAIRDNDSILAVVRSSGVNQDGASGGLTIPSGESQAALIRSVLEKGKIKPDEVDYVEAHGPGTPLGDPIEVRAIGAVYGKRDKSKPLLIGSVKSNIGHTEAAAGIAGVIKVVLSLQNNTMPAHLNFERLNPHIDADFPFEIPVQSKSWKRQTHPRRAGVSAFGFGGTNAHAIIEEAPERLIQESPIERSHHMVTLSAKTKQALDDRIASFSQYLETTQEAIGDIAFTANAGRNHFEYRTAVIVKDLAELKQKLAQCEITNVEVLHKTKIIFKNLPEGDFQRHLAKNQITQIDIGPHPDWEKLFSEVAKDYLNGADIDWKNLDALYQRKKVTLPTYPFQRQRYWAETAQPVYGRKLWSVHPLLGEKQTRPDGEIDFFGQLQLSAVPYLRDHRVFDSVVYPGAGYLEMLFAGATIGLDQSSCQLSNVSIESALGFSASKPVNTQVHLIPSDTGYETSVYSQADGEGVWKCHAKGSVVIGEISEASPLQNVEALKARCGTKVIREDFYKSIQGTGIQYGEQFQTLRDIYLGEKEAFAELQLSASAKDYLAHPGLLDGCFQLSAVSVIQKNNDSAYLPVACDVVKFYAPLGEHVFAYWQEKEITDTGMSGNITIYSPSGEVLVAIEGFHCRKTTEHALKQSLISGVHVEDWLYEWVWQEFPLEKSNSIEPLGHWLVFSDGKVSDGLVNFIESKGGSCQCISADDHPKTKEAFVDLLLLALLQEKPLSGILHAASSGECITVTSDSIRAAQSLGTQSFLHLCQALVSLQDSLQVPLFLLTEKIMSSNLVHSPLLGMFKTITLEHPELNSKLIDLDIEWDFDLLCECLVAKNNETLLAIKHNKLFVPRFFKSRDAKVKRHELTRPDDDLFRLQDNKDGLLENLTLVSLEVKDVLDPDEVEVEVHAVGLNFRDVLTALGFSMGVPGPLGGDGAGVITRVGSAVKEFKVGDAVVGLLNGSLARKTCVHRDNITMKPDSLSFIDAAALPSVFLTAYYAFTRSTVLKNTDTVLIHAGAGGVGQAAIQLAKNAGAKIIVTAGSEKKRAFLKAQGIEHVFDSRSLSYGKDIEALTGGVDVVLNSLSGKGFIETTVGICKKGARFLEIGKKDIWSKEQMQKARPDITYDIIALDYIAHDTPKVVQEMWQELIPMFQLGQLKPIPVTCFPIEEAIQAFEYMQSAKQIGKVVITLEPKRSIQDVIRSDSTYLLTGGLGSLGVTLIKWLIDMGAKHLVLTGRRDADKSVLQELETHGVTITYVSMDISDEQAVADLLTRLYSSINPLKGIFHLAGILDDGSLMEQNWDRFEKVFAPKVYGSFFLSKYSKDLDLFVLFSSAASSMGSPGQTNYSAANAFMDALCVYRNQQGVAAKSISWGPWGEIGLAKGLASRHAKGGMLAMKTNDAMRAFEEVLLSRQPHVTVIDVDWKKFIKQMVNPPVWFLHFSDKKESSGNFIDTLEALAAEERSDAIEDYVTSTVKSVLGLSGAQKIDSKRSLFKMGLDSLMAIELKNRLQAGIGKSAILSSTFIFDCPSVEDMVRYLERSIKLKGAVSKTDLVKEKVPEKVTRKAMDKRADEMNIDEILNAIKEDENGN